MNAHELVNVNRQVWKAALGEVPPANWPAEVRGVTPDSRQVREGVVFVAVRGNREDGHAFIADAVGRGACAVVCEEAPRHCGVPVARVEDARVALARIAAAVHGFPGRELRIYGVTGTNGKTTVAAFIRQLLEAGGTRCGLLGTVSYAFGNREIPARRTTPGAEELHGLLRSMRGAGCEACAMEISSHALQQRRVEGLEVDTAIFTNLSQDHLDYHKDMEEYFEVKKRLFAFPSVRRWIVGEDEWSDRLAEEFGGEVIRCGLGKGCDVRAERIRADWDGSRARVITPWGETEVEVPVAGEHNLRNALQAVAAMGGEGVEMEELGRRCVSLRAAPGRLESVASGVGRVVVDYAHTPDALENVLRTLRPLTPGRLVVLFGCGGDRDRGKRAPMAAHAAAYGDVLILTNDNPRTEDPNRIFADMIEGLPSNAPMEVIPDRAAAIRRGVEMLAADDLLLIAGKGHEAVQEFASARVPFDDRDVARACLRARDEVQVRRGD